VQVSQQWENWASFPSPLPQVVLHVAVDAINADSLANEFGIPAERIRIVPNAVDLARIPARVLPLSNKPRHALIFVKQNGPYVDALQRACAARGMTAEALGPGVGAVVADPLTAMAGADLVVGSARIAIEAAAAGAAVLVADHRGLAGLLTTTTFDRFRRHNFGRAVLTLPLEEELIGSEIDRYDADDAASVSAMVRGTASVADQISALEGIFAEAVHAFRRNKPSEDTRRKALATYLSRHLPRDGETSPRHALQTEAAATSEPGELVERLAGLVSRLSAIAATHRSEDATQPAWGPRPRDVHADGCNLLVDAESLDRNFTASSIATLERVEDSSDVKTAYRIVATGGISEHYIQHWSSGVMGAVTFSLEARQGAGTSKLRIQLLDVDQNGVYADFDFSRQLFTLRHLGAATRRNGGFTQGAKGWYRLWITAVMPVAHSGLSFIIQLADQNDLWSFEPAGESVTIRGLQIERGDLPSRYDLLRLSIDDARARAANPPMIGEGTAPLHSSELEGRVAAIYSEILEISDVRPEDDLISLGGDSLQAVRIGLEIERRFAVRLPVELLESSGCVRDMARFIEQERAGYP
jgi:acyl carrier protein